MLDDLKLIHQRDSHDLLGHAGSHPGSDPAWEPTVPTARNLAKQLALEIIGKSVVIYGGEALVPAAEAWKRGFNQYAKQLAWVGAPASDVAGELAGWSAQPIDKPYVVVELRSSYESRTVQRHFEVAGRLLSGRRPAPLVVQLKGPDLAAHIQWATTLGEFVTIYTAILHGLDPSKNTLVERYAKEMAV